MPITGTLPVTGPIAPTSTGDTYPSHFAEYGKGGYRVVADNTARDNITTLRREEGMLVFSIATATRYRLDSDLTTWIPDTVALPADIMLKSVYDPNDDGIVTNSHQLESQGPAYYLARANHTGTQAQSTVTNLVADLAAIVADVLLKGDMFKADYDADDNQIVDDSELLEGNDSAYHLNRANHTGTIAQADVTNLVADLATKVDSADVGVNGGPAGPLVGGLVPIAQIPFAGTAYLGTYDANTNTPLLTNGDPNPPGDFYIATVAGAAGPQGATAIADVVVYDGAVWQVGPSFTGGLSQLTTALGVQSGPAVVLDDTSYLNASTDKNFVDDDQLDAMLNANAPDGGNPFATMDDIIAAAGVIQIDTDAGSFNGPIVTIDDTSHIAPSTDRNYATDDEKDAMTNANSPSSSNPFATMDDVTAAVVISNNFLTAEMFANGQTLGGGSQVLLTTLGYTNVSAAAAWSKTNANYPIPINVNTMSIDFIAHQELFYYMRDTGASAMYSPGGKSYYFSHTLYLPRDQSGVPSNRRSLRFCFYMNGSRYRNSSGINQIMFDRYPVNQADTTQLVGYSYRFFEGVWRGNGSNNPNDICLRLGASSFSSFQGMNIENCGVGLDLQFCLETSFRDFNISAYGLYGVKLINGQWSGAGMANAQSNIVKIDNYRSYNSPGNTPISSIYFGGNHTVTGDVMTFEGDLGSQHHIYYENPGAFGVNVCNFRNLYFEFAGCSRAAIRFSAGKGQYIIDTFRTSIVASDLPVFLEAEHHPTLPGVQPLHIVLRNSLSDDLDSKLRSKSHLNQNAYGHKWYIENVNLMNNSQANNATNFDTLLAGSFIPTNQQVRFTPPL